MNCTWDFNDVLDSRDFFRQNHIFMIEEPIRSDYLDGYRRLTESLGDVRVAGIESAQGLSDYAESMLSRPLLDGLEALPAAEQSPLLPMLFKNYIRLIPFSLQF